MFPVGEFAALLVSFTWSFAAIASVPFNKEFGVVAFNRVRVASILVIFCFIAIFFTGNPFVMSFGNFLSLALSGIIGIFIGDLSFYTSIKIIGARKAAIIFSTNAPITAILGFIFFDQTLAYIQIGGIAMVSLGVFIAVAFTSKNNKKTADEIVDGSLLMGVGFAFLAALCQSSGMILAQPVVSSGVDPISVSFIRSLVAFIPILITTFIKHPSCQSKKPINMRLILGAVSVGLVGSIIGMSLTFYAQSKTSVGLVAVLSSMSPIVLLPALWVMYKAAPPIMAWVGALFGVIGTVLIVSFH